MGAVGSGVGSVGAAANSTSGVGSQYSGGSPSPGYSSPGGGSTGNPAQESGQPPAAGPPAKPVPGSQITRPLAALLTPMLAQTPPAPPQRPQTAVAQEPDWECPEAPFGPGDLVIISGYSPLLQPAKDAELSERIPQWQAASLKMGFTLACKSEDTHRSSETDRKRLHITEAD